MLMNVVNFVLKMFWQKDKYALTESKLYLSHTILHNDIVMLSILGYVYLYSKGCLL